MRVMLVFLIAVLFSCNEPTSGSTSAAGNVNPTTPKPTPVFTAGKVDDRSKPIPTAEKPDIKITIDGLTATGSAKLVGMFQGENFLIAEAPIKGTSIHFTGTEPLKQGLGFLLLPDNSNFQVILSEDQTFTLQTNIASMNESMKVSGSKDNELLYQTMTFEAANRQKLAAATNLLKGYQDGTPQKKEAQKKQYKILDERIDYINDLKKNHPNLFFTKFKLAGQNPDMREFDRAEKKLANNEYAFEYRQRFWNDVDFSDERLMWTPVIHNKLQKFMNELTPQAPDSIIASADLIVQKALNYPEYFKYFSNWITINFEPTKTKVMDAEAVYVHMIQNYFTNDLAFWSDSVEVFGLQTRAYEMAASLIGKKGPDVIANDIDGKQHSIYGMKSDYILVYMFNPDCEHCAVETPKLVENFAKWKKEGIEVFGVAVDTDEPKLRDYIKKNNIPFSITHDPSNRSIYAKYFVNVTPELYVLNKDRMIIGKNLKVEQVQTIIDRDRGK